MKIPALCFAICCLLGTSVQAAPTVEVLNRGLQFPWALSFLPDGQGMLITERTGALRYRNPEGQISAPLKGLPAVYAVGQGGLLDVALSPTFSQDRWVYLSYAEAQEGSASTAVGRGRLNQAHTALEDFQVIFRQLPRLSQGLHFGSRLAFDRDGYLFVTLGENNQRATAQALDHLQGKVVRLHGDGRIPQDNPFVGRADAQAQIWSYGHRNPQGAALNPWTGQLWTHEHGPRGGDEINLPLAGKNYGWPLATHGVNYSFLPIPEAQGKHLAGTEAAQYVWEKSPAISGMAFYDHARFSAWQHSLFVGALAGAGLIRLQLDGDQIVHEERLLEERRQRIRDVRQGPDGYLYVLTDSPEAELLKVGLEQPL